MAGIRVNSGVIRVEVNDKGDTIALRKDFNFINNVLAFADGLENLQKEYEAKAASIADDDASGKLDLLYTTHKQLHDALDSLFGKDTCKKVFGDGEVDVVPNMDAVVDFCTQITPYIVNIAKSLGGGQGVPTKQSNNVVANKPVGYMGGGETNVSNAFMNLMSNTNNGDGDNEV